MTVKEAFDFIDQHFTQDNTIAYYTIRLIDCSMTDEFGKAVLSYDETKLTTDDIIVEADYTGQLLLPISTYKSPMITIYLYSKKGILTNA